MTICLIMKMFYSFICKRLLSSSNGDHLGEIPLSKYGKLYIMKQFHVQRGNISVNLLLERNNCSCELFNKTIMIIIFSHRYKKSSTVLTTSSSYFDLQESKMH